MQKSNRRGYVSSFLEGIFHRFGTIAPQDRNRKDQCPWATVPPGDALVEQIDRALAEAGKIGVGGRERRDEPAGRVVVVTPDNPYLFRNDNVAATQFVDGSHSRFVIVGNHDFGTRFEDEQSVDGGYHGVLCCREWIDIGSGPTVPRQGNRQSRLAQS